MSARAGALTARSAGSGDRVLVNCCACGEPTTMRVPRALLERVEVLHLCAACVESGDEAAAAAGETDEDR